MGKSVTLKTTDKKVDEVAPVIAPEAEVVELIEADVLAQIEKVNKEMAEKADAYYEMRAFGNAIIADLAKGLGALEVGSHVLYKPALDTGTVTKLRIKTADFDAGSKSFHYTCNYVPKGAKKAIKTHVLWKPKGEYSSYISHEDLIPIGKKEPKAPKTTV